MGGAVHHLAQCEVRLQSVPHAASTSSEPNEDLHATLCDWLTASNEWTDLPVRRHLPRRMYAAPLEPHA
eukprot:7846778-Pyramimonas_sp.AAC.1